LPKLKILRIIPSVDPKGGGPAEGILQVSKELIRMGHEVELLSMDKPNARCLVGYPIRVHAVGPAKGKYAYCPNISDWLNQNAKCYDAIIVSGLWQHHGFSARQTLIRLGIPYYVFTHGMLDPWFKRTYPLKHLKKWLYWPWAEYRVLRDARAVIFTCEEERLLARQSFWLYRVNEAVTAYGTSSPPSNSEELSRHFLSVYPQLKDKRLILFLSRIHEKKGCDLLLDAFAQVVQTNGRLHLVMAGPDQTGWTSVLKAQAERLDISEHITWTGMLQGEMKWGAFYSAEVFCLPSHQENFGIVVAEALACGKPVLISNKVNIWREIEADSAGFIDEDTVEGAVRNLDRWLALDSENYVTMCERAKNCFKNRFHIQRAGERLLEIINEHIL
jgi:glycosyltransferase involved in cell wall biosynthesis